MSIIDIMEKACKIGASDIHLTQGSPIIYRIEGELITEGTEKMTGDTLKEFAHILLKKSGLFDSHCLG